MLDCGVLPGPSSLLIYSHHFLGLADAAIAGHLDQAYYLATVTVGAELLVIFFGTFSFLRMGTTGLVAQAVGANDQAHSFRIVTNAVFLALGVGSILLFAGALAIDPLFTLRKTNHGNE